MDAALDVAAGWLGVCGGAVDWLGAGGGAVDAFLLDEGACRKVVHPRSVYLSHHASPHNPLLGLGVSEINQTINQPLLQTQWLSKKDNLFTQHTEYTVQQCMSKKTRSRKLHFASHAKGTWPSVHTVRLVSNQAIYSCHVSYILTLTGCKTRKWP